MIAPSVEVMAIGAALLSAIFFGIEGTLGKRGIEAGGDAILASLVVAVVSLLVFGGVATVVSEPVTAMAGDPVGAALFFASGALSSGFGVILIYAGIRRVGASVNSAVLHSRPLYAAIFGFVLLSESLPWVTVVGICILVGGLIVISTSHGGNITGWEYRDFVVPIVAAGLVALGNVIRRYALTQSEIPLIEGIAVNAVGGLVVVAVYIALRRQGNRLGASREAYAWFVIAGFAVALALLCLFFALERERVAIVEAIVATAPLFTLIMSVILLRDTERVTWRLLGGTLLVVVGAVFIIVI